MMKKKRKGDKTKTKLVDADEAAPITEDDCHILVGRSLLGSCQSFSFFLSLILFLFVFVFYPCSLDIIHSICFCLKDILFTYLTFILVFFFCSTCPHISPVALSDRPVSKRLNRCCVLLRPRLRCIRNNPIKRHEMFLIFPIFPLPKKKRKEHSEKTETHKNMLLYCSFIDVYSSRGLFQMMSPSELYILLCDKTKTRITS